MPKTIYCPFWKWCEETRVHCEGGKLVFPDRAAKEAFTGTLCGNRWDWRRCSLARMLNDYYERRA